MARGACLWVLVAGVLAFSCGSDPKEYTTGDSQPDDVLSDGSWDSGLDIPMPDLGDLPDASGVLFNQQAPLAVKILSPSSAATFSVSNGSVDGTPMPSVVISGVVVGEFTKLYVESERGVRQEIAPPTTPGSTFFFTASPLELNPPTILIDVWETRTTVVWVVAENADGQKAWDTVRITATPGFQFPSPLTRYPDAVFSDESTDVLFTLDLNQVSGFDSSQVVLMESDSTCSTKLGLSAKFMADDGDIVASGDQLAEDHIYTKVFRLQKGAAGVRYFRAAVTVDFDGEKLVAYTPCVPIYVVNRISPMACTAAQQALQKAQQLYDAQLAASIPLEQAKRVVVAWLDSVAVVAQAGASEGDPLVWVAFQSGFFGAVAPTVWEKDVATSLFSSTGVTPASLALPTSRLVASVTPEKSSKWLDYLKELSCPPWRSLPQSNPMTALRAMGQAGLAFLAGPGGTGFAGLNLSALDLLETGFSTASEALPTALPGLWRLPQGVVLTQVDAVCQNLMEGPDSCIVLPDGSCCTDCAAEPVESCPSHLECRVSQAASNQTPVGTLYDHNQIDLAMGRLVLGAKHWGITSAFVAAYGASPRGPDVAFLGYSHSLDAAGMIVAFLSTGTRTIVGTQATVSPSAAEGAGANLLRTAIEQAKPLATVVPQLGEDLGDHPWRLVGAGDTDFSYGELINPAFSTGDLKGWNATGDARVLAYWCEQGPVAQYMAFLSTGVGFTPQTGSLKQEFCLPAGKLVFRGSFQFISHELLVSCGLAQYQDQLTMTLTSSSDQSLSLLGSTVDAVTVDMLCPCDAGACGTCPECGSASCQCGVWNEPAGQPALSLWPAECAFDDGDAWGSGWRTPAGVNISGLAGLKKPLTMAISVSDRGDSAGDTSVLIDSLVFE